jgi:hypothetical protein
VAGFEGYGDNELQLIDRYCKRTRAETRVPPETVPPEPPRWRETRRIAGESDDEYGTLDPLHSGPILVIVEPATLLSSNGGVVSGPGGATQGTPGLRARGPFAILLRITAR